MDINIKMIPASHGDAFFISIPNQAFNILVDTGIKSTYDNFIKQQLKSLKDRGELLNVLIITHIDSDHIGGSLSLLKDNKSSTESKIIEINDIWHNSYRHIQSSMLKAPDLRYKQRNQNILKKIEMLGLQSEESTTIDGCSKSISAEQGSSLASMIQHGKYNWNKYFDGNAVMIENKRTVQLTSEIELILLSPNQQKLDDLKSFWFRELRRKGYLGKEDKDLFYDDAFEFSMAIDEGLEEKESKPISIEDLDIEQLSNKDFIEDNRYPNGSSIAFILSYKGKKVLFLGDSHPTVIEESLRELYPDLKSIWFDAIKVSHHGSKGNTSPSLLNLIDSGKYIISTNSKSFNHPDLETLARIINRTTEKTRYLYFNYEHEAYRLFNNPDLMRTFQYSVTVVDENLEISI
ncbi:AVAST type 1 anti-phage system MBL fold metallo-hydrolase Avs1a [Ignatzschineria cameli]|uniref:Metallo-beta-lactamase domain-containing protein n=1 Tax=Ignatzschineria cameli TaxID=2182793 RepID=A0ABX5L1A5_9GAMM|nr:AVAST type 1 anti-phage system MBL fold metallo-hydrolase Avs1a [Ignatzschineria cameli]PWD91034.1 hypothetical protein DC079_02360 [Ignatzschineria cameli]PWD92676.1 hypothetical protein DC081_02360 [Ignatzschineria cameli]PWD93696.1 hypothetical protein DC078_02360 [Ignatzschineria cameli]